MLVKIKTKLVVILFLSIMVSSFGSVKKSQAWIIGDAIPATLMHEAWLTATETFKNTMIANLKQQANNLIRDRIRVLLTGRGQLVITDYDEFIFGGARDTAEAYTRDFFRVLGDGVGDTTAAIYNDVENALLSPESELSTIDQYVQGGVDNLFDESQGGGAQALIAATSNPYNNAFGVYLRGQAILDNEEERAQRIAEIEAMAGQGFASQRDSENNLINLPGSVIASLTAKAESTYIDMVNMARSIPEIVGTVAANMLSKTIEAGIVKVTSPIDDKLRSIHDSVDGGIRDVQEDIYGGFGVMDRF